MTAEIYILPFTRVHLQHPVAVAVDSKGNKYVECAGDAFIAVLGADDSQSRLPIKLKGYGPMAVDGEGNVYFADRKAVSKWSPAGKQVQLQIDGLRQCDALATDPRGDLYVAGTFRDRKTHGVARISASGHRDMFPLVDVSHIAGVAADGHGNVFITSEHSRFRPTAVSRLSLKTGSQTVIEASHDLLVQNWRPGMVKLERQQMRYGGIAVDLSGNVYAALSWGQVLAFQAESGLMSEPFGEYRFSSPRGVATDTAGNVYVAEHQLDRVLMVAP